MPRVQGPRVVGQMSDLIQEFPGRNNGGLQEYVASIDGINHSSNAKPERMLKRTPVEIY